MYLPELITLQLEQFVSVIENVISWSVLLATITHFLGQLRSRLILQLIKDILRILQNLLRYLMVPLFQHFCAIIACLTCYFFFKFKWISSSIIYIKSVIALFACKLLDVCNISIKWQMLLNNCHYILLNYTLAFLRECHEHHLLAYSLFCLWS